MQFVAKGGAASSGSSFFWPPWILFFIALAASLALAWMAYQPGLTGGFLFDDPPNLQTLGAAGPINNFPAFLRYITSGEADPTGRPLTLLSFLLDAQDWPADPAPFKYTNVLFHLLNGILLTWTLLVLGRRANLGENVSATAALLGASAWMLHPLLVSTTLYVVQREAMLPATFTLLGIICWYKGRECFEVGASTRGWLLLFFGAWGCCLLAVLCKANGILLPLLILVTDYCIKPRDGTAPRHGTHPYSQDASLRWVLLALPTIALFAWLVIHVPVAAEQARAFRPWTVGQRLLTEPRVLVKYLQLWWIPQVGSSGLFNDQWTASTTLLHPWTTLPCILAMLSLITFGIVNVRRKPFLCFGILFFVTGHLIESTYIPLELYFEHRNYLPAMFMLWPIAIKAAVRVQALSLRAPGRSSNDSSTRPGIYAGIAALAVLGGLAMLTHARATDWSHPTLQALLWARINPESPRAQALAASQELDAGRSGAAINRLKLAIANHPSEVQLTLNLASAECNAGAIEPAVWGAVLASLRTTNNGSRAAFDWFVASIQPAREQACEGLDLSRLEGAIAAFRSNTRFSWQRGRQQDFRHIDGLLSLARGRYDEALKNFNEAMLISPSHDIVYRQVAILGSAGRPDLALKHLALFWGHEHDQKPGIGMPMLHAWVLERQDYWGTEGRRLEKALLDDMAARGMAPDTTHASQ